jgi:hypothetical protein
MNKSNIGNASELRAALLLAIEAVCAGRMNVSQANAVVGLSAEVHKSIRQEWDMRVYAAENFAMQNGEVIKLLDSAVEPVEVQGDE